jgi:hypothetical protein
MEAETVALLRCGSLGPGVQTQVHPIMGLAPGIQRTANQMLFLNAAD